MRIFYLDYQSVTVIISDPENKEVKNHLCYISDYLN
ncbi:hypothetical protein ABIC45_002837 [Mucilaginibacter rubeus]